MSFYFDENGKANIYHISNEGKWSIRGDYLQVEHTHNIPGGLYKITDNKVRFPCDYKEVEGVIDTNLLTFSVDGYVYKIQMKPAPFNIPVRF
ncbi:TPA: hypothetical protein ACRX9D_004073 [Klebsiella pneumoniae]